jgi:hypothetical protein
MPAVAASGSSGSGVPVVPATVATASIRPIGCIKMGDRCSCFDQGGALVKLPIDECTDGSHTTGYVLPSDRQGIRDPRVANSVNPG